MGLRVRRPKLLVFVLLGIMLVGSSMALYASQRDGAEPPVFPAIPVSANLTPEQEQEAKAVVDASGIVKHINGDQDRKASDFYAVKVGGKEVVRMIAAWDDPVTTSGPWTSVMCQNTRRAVGTMEFTNVSKLAVHVDVPGEEVIGTAVGAAPRDGSGGAVEETLTSDHKVKVYDNKTGDLVYDGRVEDLAVKCEPGTEDD